MTTKTLTYVPHDKHLIAGVGIDQSATFSNAPAVGRSDDFPVGTPAHVDTACAAAEDSLWTYAYTTRAERAAFLETISDEVEARADAITNIGSRKSGLPIARLQGVRGRTTGQLRLFADHIRNGRFLDRRTDAAMPNRQPQPRLEIRLMPRPIGPVAAFGASNFPLAFSTAGGDTAAGCPVVVKGHSAHPGTTEIVAEAIHAAIKKCGIHPGVFSLIQGGKHDVGQALVQHPLIKAVGFTGSLAGGRALFDLCARRPEPIPFFGELGSVNPMFILQEAGRERGAALGEGWAGSLSMGAGQFCTNPGIAVVHKGAKGDAFVAAARKALDQADAQVMLTDGIAQAYRDEKDRFTGRNAVHALLETQSEGRTARPNLFETNAETYMQDYVLGEEVFGPLGLIVRVEGADEMRGLAKGFEGQLTATTHMDNADAAEACAPLPILKRKAGRVLFNGFPTGVEVCDAMVHGGPCPASTNFGATSVGTMAILRFLRRVTYQNVPVSILPGDLIEEVL